MLLITPSGVWLTFAIFAIGMFLLYSCIQGVLSVFCPTVNLNKVLARINKGIFEIIRIFQ